MTFNEFQNQAFAALRAIVEDVAKHPPTAAFPAQKDLPALLADVRGVAEEMALCATLDSAMSTLRAHQAALLGTVCLVTNLEDSEIVNALRRAYASTDSAPTMLPGYPVAACLIELCNGLELVERTPTKE